MNAIEINSLTKKFKKSTAIDNISLNVEEGEIFGFLGPNGAGKSTTMMILTTLLKPTSGNASVFGFDVITNPSKVRKNIGFVQQEIGIDEYLTARENLQFQCKISQIPKDQTQKRIEEVIDLVELTERQDEQSITFSGGMRKRLDIACGLIHRPKVLFLDEPTVGLDLQTRRKIWHYIRKIHKEFGMTIFVSTHYMEEADDLCDRVGIIDYGKIQIVDTPESMKNKLETDMITFSIIPDETKQEQFTQKIKTLDLIKNVEINGNTMVVQSSNSTQIVPKIFQTASEIGISIDSFVLNKPTLDDVFISYTGHNLRDSTGEKFNKRKEYNQSRRRGM
ncbi:MAG: ATP-binding cassette domain-containing protein [Crenarchaeota archaeon]|nr:ATP-binding cassette domain-containing protein [Thermoproteota archaeon]MDA1124738.1 ATP-binding cassette domain-containing protein [Thermoproteota archaeon]